MTGITILKDDEYLLMLQAAGIDRLYGIELACGPDALENEGAFNACLASLYGKGLIDWNGEKACIAEEYKPMFRALRDAENCVLASSAQPGTLPACAYLCGETVVSVDRGSASDSELELSSQTAADWVAEVLSSGAVPLNAGGDDELPAAGEPELMAELQLRGAAGGDVRQTLRLYDRGLYGMLELERDGETERYGSDAEKVAEILAEWTGGMK